MKKIIGSKLNLLKPELYVQSCVKICNICLLYITVDNNSGKNLQFLLTLRYLNEILPTNFMTNFFIKKLEKI